MFLFSFDRYYTSTYFIIVLIGILVNIFMNWIVLTSMSGCENCICLRPTIISVQGVGEEIIPIASHHIRKFKMSCCFKSNLKFCFVMGIILIVMNMLALISRLIYYNF